MNPPVNSSVPFFVFFLFCSPQICSAGCSPLRPGAFRGGQDGSLFFRDGFTCKQRRGAAFRAWPVAILSPPEAVAPAQNNGVPGLSYDSADGNVLGSVGGDEKLSSPWSLSPGRWYFLRTAQPPAAVPTILRAVGTSVPTAPIWLILRSVRRFAIRDLSGEIFVAGTDASAWRALLGSVSGNVMMGGLEEDDARSQSSLFLVFLVLSLSRRSIIVALLLKLAKQGVNLESVVVYSYPWVVTALNCIFLASFLAVLMQ